MCAKDWTFSWLSTRRVACQQPSRSTSNTLSENAGAIISLFVKGHQPELQAELARAFGDHADAIPHIADVAESPEGAIERGSPIVCIWD